MSILKTLGTGIAGIALIIVVILAVIAIGSIVGGLVGALIATGYNMLFGTSFAVWEAALIGSIVGVVGGASATTD